MVEKTTHKILDRANASSEKSVAGIYIYSIVADGNVIDLKRMIMAEK